MSSARICKTCVHHQCTEQKLESCMYMLFLTWTVIFSVILQKLERSESPFFSLYNAAPIDIGRVSHVT